MIGILAFLRRRRRPAAMAKIAALDQKPQPEAKKRSRVTRQASEGTEDLILCCHDGGRAGFYKPSEG